MKAISIKWTKFGYEKPPRTGYYLLKRRNVFEVIYYNVKSDIIVVFDEDFSIAYEYDSVFIEDFFWGRLPRIPMSAIISNNCIGIV